MLRGPDTDPLHSESARKPTLARLRLRLPASGPRPAASPLLRCWLLGNPRRGPATGLPPEPAISALQELQGDRALQPVPPRASPGPDPVSASAGASRKGAASSRARNSSVAGVWSEHPRLHNQQHTRTHTNTHVRTYTHRYTHSYIYKYTYISIHIHIHLHTYNYIYTLALTYIDIHTHMYTQIHS